MCFIFPRKCTAVQHPSESWQPRSLHARPLWPRTPRVSAPRAQLPAADGVVEGSKVRRLARKTARTSVERPRVSTSTNPSISFNPQSVRISESVSTLLEAETSYPRRTGLAQSSHPRRTQPQAKQAMMSTRRPRASESRPQPQPDSTSLRAFLVFRSVWQCAVF